MITLSINDEYATAWVANDDGSQSLVGVLETKALRLPKRSVAGKTGAEIKWIAYKDSVVTVDYRHED
jgi:hypothetical protein